LVGRTVLQGELETGREAPLRPLRYRDLRRRAIRMRRGHGRSEKSDRVTADFLDLLDRLVRELGGNRVERHEALLELSDRLQTNEVLARVGGVLAAEDRRGQKAALDVVANGTRGRPRLFCQLVELVRVHAHAVNVYLDTDAVK